MKHTFDYYKDRETGLGFKKFSVGPCLNLTPLDEIEEECIAKGIESAEFFGYATHEQYFYPDYYAYQPDYAEKIIKKMEKCKKPIIGFTEYFEIRNGERVYKNKLLRIKRFLNFPFRIFKKSRFIRRRVLSVGSPICCPAVTYNVKNCNNLKFDASFQNCCDWDAWERLSKEKGSFVYLKESLMGHRIHKESTTTKMIENSRRSEEEFIMFRRFWPRFIAKKLSKTFQKSYVSNDV
jgi:hypothetical protein